MDNSHQAPIEFGVNEAKINELTNLYGFKPDTETKEGYEQIKCALKVLTPIRTGIEKKRKELKAVSIAWGKSVDMKAKELTAPIAALEAPLSAAKKEFDDREKRKKQERLARLQVKVDSLKAYPETAIGQPSNVIAEMIDDLDAQPIEDFYDLSKEAAAAKQSSLDALAKMLTDALSNEKIAEEKRKLEEQQEAMRQQLEQQQKELRDLQEKNEEAERKEQARIFDEEKAKRDKQADQPTVKENTTVEPTPIAAQQPEVSEVSHCVEQGFTRSEKEIDISCWLFDNTGITQEQARAITHALVTGKVPHISAIQSSKVA